MSVAKNPTNQILLLKILIVVGMIATMLGFGLYQGLVHEDYRRVSPREFLTKNFWQQVSGRGWRNEQEFLACNSTVASESIYNDTSRFTPRCGEAGCSFEVSLASGSAGLKKVATLPVVSEQNEKLDPKVTAATVLAADLTKGRLLYEVPQYKKVYFVEFSQEKLMENGVDEPKLWHEISMEPFAGNKLSFVAVKRSQAGRDFLVAWSPARSEYYVYGLEDLWLKKFELPKNLAFSPQQKNDLSSCVSLFDGSSGETRTVNLEGTANDMYDKP